MNQIFLMIISWLLSLNLKVEQWSLWTMCYVFQANIQLLELHRQQHILFQVPATSIAKQICCSCVTHSVWQTPWMWCWWRASEGGWGSAAAGRPWELHHVPRTPWLSYVSSFDHPREPALSYSPSVNEEVEELRGVSNQTSVASRGRAAAWH